MTFIKIGGEQGGGVGSDGLKLSVTSVNGGTWCVYGGVCLRVRQVYGSNRYMERLLLDGYAYGSLYVYAYGQMETTQANLMRGLFLTDTYTCTHTCTDTHTDKRRRSFKTMVFTIPTPDRL